MAKLALFPTGVNFIYAPNDSKSAMFQASINGVDYVFFVRENDAQILCITHEYSNKLEKYVSRYTFTQIARNRLPLGDNLAKQYLFGPLGILNDAITIIDSLRTNDGASPDFQTYLTPDIHGFYQVDLYSYGGTAWKEVLSCVLNHIRKTTDASDLRTLELLIAYSQTSIYYDQSTGQILEHDMCSKRLFIAAIMESKPIMYELHNNLILHIAPAVHVIEGSVSTLGLYEATDYIESTLNKREPKVLHSTQTRYSIYANIFQMCPVPLHEQKTHN